MRHARFRFPVLFCLLCSAVTRADTVTFEMARIGNSYSAAMFGDDPLVGKEIAGGRIYLDVEVAAGFDAADFFTDILLPIEPYPGSDPAVVLSGADLNWSGSGRFTYFEETTRFNGTFIARRYGAETPGEGYVGVMLDGRIELDVPDYVRGDFNDNLELDQYDIDALASEIQAGTYWRPYDLNGDGSVDLVDHRLWVRELKHTWLGDANLNGAFDSQDMVAVFQAGEYEDTIEGNSLWATGDWTADGEFSSDDMVAAFQDGGYEAPPTGLALSVPEPGGAIAITLAMAAAFWLRRS